MNQFNLILRPAQAKKNLNLPHKRALTQNLFIFFMAIAKNGPIGIFDSGIGGLTVAAGISEALPQESIIYLGDTAHLPYGEKSPEAIANYALHISRFLVDQGCKMLVIACNTASAAALGRLKAYWGNRLPIVDVIRPLVKSMAQQNYKKVGVIGTKVTTRIDQYPQQLQALRPDIAVTSLATGMLASMIEEGFINNAVSQAVLHQYLSYPDFQDIEALLLACTHYPLIRPEIEAFYEGRVAVFDSIAAVVEEVKQQLAQNNLEAEQDLAPLAQFYVTDYTPSFEKATALFYKRKLHLQELDWKEEGLSFAKT